MISPLINVSSELRILKLLNTMMDPRPNINSHLFNRREDKSESIKVNSPDIISNNRF